MKKEPRPIMENIAMIVKLFIICGIAAGSLAIVNQVTSAPIAGWEQKQKQEALAQVLPRAKNFTVVVPDAQWEASDDTGKLGDVFITAIQGYGGPIKMAFGVDGEGRMTGLRIISHTETPGLGAKITQESFYGQFADTPIDGIALKKDDPEAGEIDAITAATITSRAVTNAVRKTAEAHRNKDAEGDK